MTSTVCTTEAIIGQSGAVPGVVKPGWCWAVHKATPDSYGFEHRYEIGHFPTWEGANRETIERQPTEATYVVSEVECDRVECLHQRRSAEIAYREHQDRLAAEQEAVERERRRAEDDRWARLLEVERGKVAAERDHQQRLREIEAGYRERQTEALVDEADYRQQRLELLAGEAEFRERQLQVQVDEAAEQAATARAWRLVEAAQSEIGKADAKAGLVITLELALIGVVGSGTLGAAGALRWAAIAVLVAGVLAAVWAVFPRPARRTGGGETKLNYGAVRGLDSAELADWLRGVDELEAVSAEAVVLARITHAKYTWIRWAMLTGVAGLVLAVIATGIGAAA